MGRTRRRRTDATTAVIAAAVMALLVIAGSGAAPAGEAAAPPPGGFAHGAAGSGRNGVGGSIAPSPSMRSWPGTGADGNGGSFSFIGAHYGSMWQVPNSPNNSQGVGYCVMEDVGGEGAVTLQPDPAVWDAGEMARAAALMSSFGGDRVVPYGIDASGRYDAASGEWQLPALLGGGEYSRRRHVAVNFGVKMFLEDVSPTGAVAGLKLARDTAVVDGSGSDFSALRNGYDVARRLAEVADAQHAVGSVRLELRWATGSVGPPTSTGTFPLEVRAIDEAGKPVGLVPVIALSTTGIDGARTRGAAVAVDRSGESPAETARWNAAAALGWPTVDMAGAMAADRRFAVGANPLAADVTDATGVARFDVTITSSNWEVGFHVQAPTADVSLYAGSGIQGQVTWSGPPQSASVHAVAAPPPPPPPPPPTTTTPPVPLAVQDLVVRKVLDAADVQGGRDMSGFVFELTDGQDDIVARLTTGPDGWTPSVEASAGTYTLTEVGRPPWGAGLGDDGPSTFEFTPDGSSDDRYEVVYTNTVQDPSIDTAARDAADGDQVVDLALGDAVIVDTIDYAGVVPGTEYVATGELMVGDGDMIATGITASAAFVPDASDGSVAVRFDVSADSPLAGHTVVIYQELAVASSGRVVAVHADPLATEQTIRFTDIVTTTTPTTAPPTTLPPTTAPPTTLPPTTVAATTTSPPTTSTTSTVPVVTTTTGVAAPPAQLPRTGGSGAGSLVWVAATVLMLGLALLLATDRGPTRPRAGSNPESVGHQRDRQAEADVGANGGDPASRLHRVLRR